MLLAKNPSAKKVAEIVAESPSGTAKWVRCSKTGDRYVRSAEDAFHAAVAFWLELDDYTKGMMILDPRPQAPLHGG